MLKVRAQTLTSIFKYSCLHTGRWSISCIDGWLFFTTCFSLAGPWYIFSFNVSPALICTLNPLCFLPYFFPSFVIMSLLSWLIPVLLFLPSLLLFLFVSGNTFFASFPSLPSFHFSLASLRLWIESYQEDVEWHCEETGVLLHHWRHQQLCDAQQR